MQHWWENPCFNSSFCCDVYTVRRRCLHFREKHGDVAKERQPAPITKNNRLHRYVVTPHFLIQPRSEQLCRFRVDPIPYDTPKPAGHTRFVCVSDTHSRTDGIQMPYGDVLLHMGDFTELGLPSEVKKFNDWLGIDSHNIDMDL